ncbi:LysE family translocator [Rhizobium sp. RAF56]|uniref:LysE family translocator n=1 Tax=Rhizobium sp. RAF56 TaxID=3233062 RepID=UPI003F9E95AB
MAARSADRDALLPGECLNKMPLLLFIKAALLGVVITAPVGPVGTLCINRSIEHGFWAGFSGGLGTALGDASYALVAVAGLVAFSSAVTGAAVPLALVGGLVFCWIGYRGLRRGQPEAARIGASDFLRTTISTFVLTISNPAAILSFGALFAAFGLSGDTHRFGPAIIVVGVFSGSLAWWLFLSGAVSLARDRLSVNFTAKVRRATNYMLILFGVGAFGSAAWSCMA